MDSSLQSRFVRQIILPEVGPAGQRTWSRRVFRLAGSDPAAASCREALIRAGAGQVLSWDGVEADPDAFHLALTADPLLRLKVSRSARDSGRPALFGWTLSDGFALALFTHREACPCLECFISSNPKAFGRSDPSWDRVLGAQAASEALLAVLRPSPLENHAWLTYVHSGISDVHPVRAAESCPACRRVDPGAS